MFNVHHSDFHMTKGPFFLANLFSSINECTLHTCTVCYSVIIVVTVIGAVLKHILHMYIVQCHSLLYMHRTVVTVGCRLCYLMHKVLDILSVSFLLSSLVESIHSTSSCV